MITNMNALTISEPISTLFQNLASPARVSILLAIGHGEACVCHLEAILGWRQAYISQHLMSLRKAEVLKDRKVGRFVYYSLREPSILSLVQSAANLCGLKPWEVEKMTTPDPGPNCECPICLPNPIQVDEVTTR